MGKDHWRRVQEEMHQANWDAVSTWLDTGRGSRDLRSRVMRNSAGILIGDALHEISLLEGLAFLRPDLVEREEELSIQAQNADRDRLQGMNDHPTYKLLELDLGLIISLLVPGELKVNKDIKGGNSNNTHFQARLIVGEKLLEIVGPQ